MAGNSEVCFPSHFPSVYAIHSVVVQHCRNIYSCHRGLCPLHIYSQIQNLNGHGSFLCLTFIPMNFPVYHFLLFIVFCFNSKLDVYSYSTLQVCPPQTTLYYWQICLVIFFNIHHLHIYPPSVLKYLWD